MADNSNLPKWATLDRKNHLLKLWSLFGNKCLQGHQACPILNHYVTVKFEVETVAKPISLHCRDRQGNPLLDSEGKQLILTLYKPVPVQIEKPTLTRLYDLKAEQLISNWIADDREQRQAQRLVEQRALHSLGERSYPLRGTFSNISQAIYADKQPLYYIEGLGVSGLTMKPFAKVRISSSYMRLFIDLGDTLRGVSKARRRKAIRYGKPLPTNIEANIALIVGEAVKDYIAH